MLDNVVNKYSLGLWLFGMFISLRQALIQPLFLFLSHYTVPRAACLGESGALFSRPFESRPSDPLRREIFRQQAVGGGSCWFAPSAVPSEAPLVLAPSHQASAGPIPACKRRHHKRSVSPVKIKGSVFYD